MIRAAAASFARDASKSATTGPATPEEWPATRVEPASQDEIDEWQATRIQARQPNRHRRLARSAAARRRHAAAADRSAALGRFGAAAESPDAWAATRAQTALATQILEDEGDYLATEKEEIGRQIGGNERELFVSCAPAEALQQQFEHLQPNFIAVHDIATSSSRKLLTGIAAASGRAVQKLVVRRQGYGTALATLEFVELPTADNQLLRLYTTEADADTASRHAIARVLLAYSRLGVVMVGELPGHAIASALKPLHDDIIAGPWPNRNLLLLPLASASTLVTHGLDLGRGTGVAVRTTPQVARPPTPGPSSPAPGAACASRRPPTAASSPSSAHSRPAAYQPKRPPLATGLPSGDTLPMEDARPPVVADDAADAGDRDAVVLADDAVDADRALRQAAERAERRHQLLRVRDPERQADRPCRRQPGLVELAAHGSTLIAAMMAASRALGFGHALPEAAISLGAHHLLLRGVPRNPGLAMHAVLDKASANLTLARLQVLRMDSLFEETQTA